MDNYRILWWFNACAYEPHLQATVRLTGSVRLIESGIALAIPSKLKYLRYVTINQTSESNVKKDSIRR